MHRRQVLKVLTGLALCPLCAPKSTAADGHWSYEGADGPARWGDLDPANRSCSLGGEQSPLDIRDTIRARLPSFQLAWGNRADTIVNNGHTVQLNFGDGSRLEYRGTSYRLLQVHFHCPSEHLIAGKSFPMEAHFVHAAPSGSLAVIGVLMEAGRPNAAFERIVGTMPQKEGPAIKADTAIDPHGLLPRNHNSYYRYSGSLTTPPCSETVDWLLLTSPVQVAQADIARFAALYPMNARPAQKPNRRFVLRSA